MHKASTSASPIGCCKQSACCCMHCQVAGGGLKAIALVGKHHECLLHKNISQSTGLQRPKLGAQPEQNPEQVNITKLVAGTALAGTALMCLGATGTTLHSTNAILTLGPSFLMQMHFTADMVSCGPSLHPSLSATSIAACQAGNQQYDANQYQNSNEYHQLHFIVLPPHPPLQLSGIAFELLCLHDVQKQLQRIDIELYSNNAVNARAAWQRYCVTWSPSCSLFVTKFSIFSCRLIT